MLYSEGTFEGIVFSGGIGVHTQEIAKEQFVMPEGASILGQMQMARARPPGAMTEEDTIGEIGTGYIFVAKSAERLNTLRKIILQRAHRHHNVYDWLRAQARNRRTANMLDRDDSFTQGALDAIFLVLVPIRPMWIILDENDCCTHRISSILATILCELLRIIHEACWTQMYHIKHLASSNYRYHWGIMAPVSYDNQAY
jgi:hypothetical protein